MTGLMVGEKNGMYGVTGKDHPSYGIPHLKETLKKISDAVNAYYITNDSPMKGKHHSVKSKRLISEKAKGNTRWLGKKHTESTKKKMSQKAIGRIWSTEVKQRKSIKITGSGNPNWKGGTSFLPYCIAWTDGFKLQIKERDGNKCQNPLCTTPDAILSVHHINYQKSDCAAENLITLCLSCNSKANTDRAWHESFYGEIMRRNNAKRRMPL